MQVTVKGIGFSEVERKLGSLKNKAGAVMINVLRRVQSNVRKNISKKVLKRYAVKSNEIKKTVHYNKPKRSELNASVWVEGGTLPLIKFKVKPQDVIKLKGIKAVGSYVDGGVKYPGRQRYKYKVLKSTSLKKSETAFVQKMQNGHIGLFRRIYQNYGSKINYNVKRKFANNKIEELHGPSVPQMVGNEEVMNPILKEAEAVYNRRIIHELNRVLGRL